MKGRRGKHLNDEILSSYIDETLSPRERAAVEQHLAQCAECARDLETLQQTVLLLKDLPAVKVPRAFTLTEADVAPQRARQRPLFGFLRSATVAAAMLLAVVITGDVLMQQGMSTMPAAFESAVMSEEMEMESPPMAKMMVEPTQAPYTETADAEPAQAMQMMEKEVEVEKEAVVEKAMVRETEAEVVVTTEVEKEAVIQEKSANNTEAPVMELAAVESDNTTEEAPVAPILSNAERTDEVPAPNVEPGEGGGNGTGMGVGGGQADDQGEEPKSMEWADGTVTPAVLRPTDIPTMTPPAQSTIAPTLEPSRSAEPTARIAQPSPVATVIAEAIRPPAEPAQSEGLYGTQRAGGMEIPLIRLLEIALLLLVLALASAAIASRQRRN